MGNFLKTQNTFSFGEISPDFYALNNIHGVSKLENMDVLPSGGLKRRPGLKKIDDVADGAIIVPFQITETEKYLLVIYDSATDVYYNDERIYIVPTPWKKEDLCKLQYAQRFNTIFFVHPDYQPRQFTKNGNNFSLTSFNFKFNSDMSINAPFMRFDDTANIGISISSSNIDNNHATLTATADLWSQDNVGQSFIIGNNQWVISSVQDARVAIGYTNTDFSFTQSPIMEWYEMVFCKKRGWPACVSFHQNRLVLACTAAIPNGIWLSKVGDFNNFDVGSGLDDDAIYTELLSAQHHQICTIVSSDKLQVLTSVGEWAISNSPLTPTNVNIKQHTSVGSISSRFLPTQQIEGCTVFISENGKDIRELDLDALGENYNATDLCVYAKHLMNNPTSIAYNQKSHQLFVVMNDGYMAVLNKYTNTEIAAWGTYKTDGLFKYVSVLDNETYVIVKRKNNTTLEKFDETCLNDATTYGFSYRVSSAPMVANGHIPTKIRIRKIYLRVMNTKTLFVNEQRMEIPHEYCDENSTGYDGDLSINLLGTARDTMKPLWSISSSEQLPTTVLSITTDGWYEL